MARHRARGARVWSVWVGAVVAVTGVVVAAALGYRVWQGTANVADDEATGGPCERTIRAVAATSFAPVLRSLIPRLREGADCVNLQVTIADGRAAADRVNRSGADLWIPDDSSWAGIAGSIGLADAKSGAGAVVATSPIYMVSDQATGAKLKAAGGSWLGLSRMVVDEPGTKLVVHDPAGDGDGLLGMGAVAEAVWLAKDMDASALWLTEAKRATRIVAGTSLALPAAPGDVGLVPEYALTDNRPDTLLIAGTDHTALLRYTWLPTAAAVANADRNTGLNRIRRELGSPAGADALAAAHLRGPNAAPLPDNGPARAPALTAKPFDVLQQHHVEHVFATWYIEDRRTNVTVVVDVSGSMASPAPGSGKPLIALVRQGCQSLGPLLPNDAKLGLWEFGTKLDGTRDHRVLLPLGSLDQSHRTSLNGAVGALQVLKTGTGLYDTILASYLAAQAAYQPGITNQVLLFTDGRNEDDPGGLTAEQLAAQLAAKADKNRPVLLSVVAFGQRPEANVLSDALKPVEGYVDSIKTADEVAAVFIHVAAGGLHS
jgi:hypothetical protein